MRVTIRICGFGNVERGSVSKTVHTWRMDSDSLTPAWQCTRTPRLLESSFEMNLIHGPMCARISSSSMSSRGTWCRMNVWVDCGSIWRSPSKSVATSFQYTSQIEEDRQSQAKTKQGRQPVSRH